jgi:hypothetical protein
LTCLRSKKKRRKNAAVERTGLLVIIEWAAVREATKDVDPATGPETVDANSGEVVLADQATGAARVRLR